MQAELNALKNDGYKSKYEKEHADFEAYKADISAKETKTAKTAAVRRYFEAKGITGKSLDIAMRGADGGDSFTSLVCDYQSGYMIPKICAAMRRARSTL